METLRAVGICVTALAAASVGTALYFWIAGDPPGKYGKAGQEDAGVSWDIQGQVGPGALGLTATCRF